MCGAIGPLSQQFGYKSHGNILVRHWCWSCVHRWTLGLWYFSPLWHKHINHNCTQEHEPQWCLLEHTQEHNPESYHAPSCTTTTQQHTSTPIQTTVCVSNPSPATPCTVPVCVSNPTHQFDDKSLALAWGEGGGTVTLHAFFAATPFILGQGHG